LMRLLSEESSMKIFYANYREVWTLAGKMENFIHFVSMVQSFQNRWRLQKVKRFIVNIKVRETKPRASGFVILFATANFDC